MQDTITGNYIAGFRKGGIVLAVVMSVLMSGCEIIPDAVNPVTWFEDDEKEAPPTAEQRKQEYPKLGAVPKRPPSLETQQSKIAEGLTADLENARYTDEKIKQEAARRAAGTSVAPATRSVPAPRPVPSAPRVSSVPPAPAARSAVPPPPVARPAAPQPVRPTVTAPARRSAVPPPPAAPRPAVPAPTQQPSVAPPLQASGSAAPQAPAVRNAPTPPQPTAPPVAPAPQTAQPPAIPALGQVVKVGTIYFSDGSTKLEQRDELILREIASAQRQTGRAVRIVGHASGRARTFDAARRHLINYQVSLERAHAVAAVLLRMGIPVGKLLVEGKGDTQPIYAEYTATGEAANRRTELYLVN